MFDSAQCLFFPPTKGLWACRDSFTFLEELNLIKFSFFKGNWTWEGAYSMFKWHDEGMRKGEIQYLHYLTQCYCIETQNDRKLDLSPM